MPLNKYTTSYDIEIDNEESSERLLHFLVKSEQPMEEILYQKQRMSRWRYLRRKQIGERFDVSVNCTTDGGFYRQGLINSIPS